MANVAANVADVAVMPTMESQSPASVQSSVVGADVEDVIDIDDEFAKQCEKDGDDDELEEDGAATGTKGKGHFDRKRTQEYSRAPLRLDAMRNLRYEIHVGDTFPTKNDAELAVREYHECAGKLVRTGGKHPTNKELAMRNDRNYLRFCCCMKCDNGADCGF